jgi:hypothetical protein
MLWPSGKAGKLESEEYWRLKWWRGGDGLEGANHRVLLPNPTSETMRGGNLRLGGGGGRKNNRDLVGLVWLISRDAHDEWDPEVGCLLDIM